MQHNKEIDIQKYIKSYFFEFLAQKFGAGYISDSFILALSIPNILITSIAAALKTNYIPIISQGDLKINNSGNCYYF